MTELPDEPWELSPEDIKERIARPDNSDLGRALGRALREIGRQVPHAKLTVDSLRNMPSLAELVFAVDLLTHDERKWGLINALIAEHQARLSLEEFEEWFRRPLDNFGELEAD